MRKIAMLGTGSNGHLAPFNDESYEIWGVASRFEFVTRADRWYELHRLDGEPEDFQRNWRRDIKKFSDDVDLWMMYPEPDLGPRVYQYPCDEMVKRFGTFFMTSSFSWMMAHMISEVRPVDGEPVETEVGIWGVDMEYGTEYAQQRAGFRHFISLCRELGITVTHFADSGLIYEPVPYPMWQDDPLLTKLKKRKKASKEKLEQLDDSIRHTRTLIAQNRMAIDELLNIKYDDEYVSRRIDFLKKELDNLLDTSESMSKEAVQYGALESEQSYMIDYLSP